MTHADIIARLTAATGPDRDLDAEIWCLTNGWRWRGVNPSTLFYAVAVDDSTYLNRNMRVADIPSLSASVDACLALIERVLPRHNIRVEDAEDQALANIWTWFGNERVEFAGKACSMPLALLLALFRALEAQEAK